GRGDGNCRDCDYGGCEVAESAIDAGPRSGCARGSAARFAGGTVFWRRGDGGREGTRRESAGWGAVVRAAAHLQCAARGSGGEDRAFAFRSVAPYSRNGARSA